MGILENLGVSNIFGGISGSSFLLWIGIIFLGFLFLILAGAITFFYYFRKNKKTQFKYQIPLFQTINGKNYHIGLDWAKELYVPDSNISLFFLKQNKIYLARPTRAMGKNEFWYSISENGEWVNFDMAIDPEHNTLAMANYDHRDTRYAYTNLKEIIKRNYKDKSVVWWKDPVVMNIISFVIMSVIFVGFCWFLIAKMGGLISEVSKLIEAMRPISDSLSQAVIDARDISSGVVKS